MEWVFAPFQQSLHMASCLLCLFIASFWETLHSPRMQHKPKHLSVPSPEPVTQGILLFLPYFSTHTFSHISSPSLLSRDWTQIFVFGARGWDVSHSVTIEALGFKYDKFNLMCSWNSTVTFQSQSFHHFDFAVESVRVILCTMKSVGQLCWSNVRVRWAACAVYWNVI